MYLWGGTHQYLIDLLIPKMIFNFLLSQTINLKVVTCLVFPHSHWAGNFLHYSWIQLLHHSFHVYIKTFSMHHYIIRSLFTPNILLYYPPTLNQLFCYASTNCSSALYRRSNSAYQFSPPYRAHELVLNVNIWFIKPFVLRKRHFS